VFRVPTVHFELLGLQFSGGRGAWINLASSCGEGERYMPRRADFCFTLECKRNAQSCETIKCPTLFSELVILATATTRDRLLISQSTIFTLRLLRSSLEAAATVAILLGCSLELGGLGNGKKSRAESSAPRFSYADLSINHPPQRSCNQGKCILSLSKTDFLLTNLAR
jgi:hypothetical protein